MHIKLQAYVAVELKKNSNTLLKLNRYVAAFQHFFGDVKMEIQSHF